MTSPRTATLLSFLERYSTTLVYAASNIVLSRLLTPTDTGLFTIGFMLIVAISTFRDFGVATYIIQEPELTDAKWRSALGVSAITCGVVFVATILASFPAGRIYDDANVTTVMQICSLTLLLIPFNALVLAWLRREFLYGILYRASLAGALTQSVVGIALAWDRHGAMSLAWGSVANSVVTLIASIHYRPRQFGCRPTLVAWRSIAGIGVYSTVGLICNEITPAAVSLFIGRFGGLASLGQFSKGASLVSMLNQALIDALLPVSLSHLAQRHRASEPLGQAFLHVLTLFTGVVWPAFAGLAAVAYPTIHLLFGSQWGAAVAPSRLIVAAGMIAAVNSLHGMVYQATGSMRRHMLVQIAVTPAQLAVLYAAAHGDLVIAAAGVAASALIEFLPSQVMVNRICNIGMRDVARAVLPSLLLVVATLAGALPALAMLPPAADNLLLPLATAVTSGAIGFLVGLWLTRHPLGAELVSFVRDARQRIATAGRSVAPKL